MAGGKGERFWPLSREKLPKQFLTLWGERSLIQQTYERIRSIFPPEEILVVTGKDFVGLVKEHLPELPPQNIIAEPEGRNTAPCIGLAAMRLFQKDREAVMAVLPADHFIGDKEVFCSSLQKAVELAAGREALVTIGITPTRPETGYGYIRKAKEEKEGIFWAAGFVEKPDHKTALCYLRSGDYFWNSGIFVWKAALILQKIQKHLPLLYSALEELSFVFGTKGEQEALEKIFPSLPAVSIDYGVMEKEESFFIVKGDFPWDDLGSWSALSELLKEDGGYSNKSHHIGLETSNCFVYSDGALIATLGVSDLIVVQTHDAVLVCAKDKAQKIRELVRLLKENNFQEYV